ncbi:hypothetical protein BKA62DRAFT_721678 [Auriculariales sp. MPI-PUGE-AT-0066]|nr:hypothetical protein BKA62DRAFT_721678 [Auriculariales sp. MPI-PUGE-AT-0066]
MASRPSPVVPLTAANSRRSGDEDEAFLSDAESESDRNFDRPGVKLLSDSDEDLPPHGHDHTLQTDTETQAQFVRNIVAETAPTLLLTTVGLVFTGELLERISEWKAFKRVDDLIILIPMLINLKGNLEMNLSARLATAANIGELDDRPTRVSMIAGSISLLQVQALIISALAAMLSFALGALLGTPEQKKNDDSKRQISNRVPRPGGPSKSRTPTGFMEFMFVLATSQAAAAASSLVLGSFMSALIIVCRRFGVDPDNVATPIASCLGDLVTLTLLAFIAASLFSAANTAGPAIICVALLFVLFGSFLLARRNAHVRPLLWSGWGAQIGAMVVSSATGMVLDHYVERFEGFGVLAIVIGGLPGSVGSVYISRLSTSLHAHAELGGPLTPSFLASARTRLTETALFLISIPVLVTFVTFLDVAGWVSFPIAFVVLFSLFFCLAVLISLVFSRIFTFWLWRRGHDPDMYALPWQSSLIDLISQLLLVGCYMLAQALGANVLAHPKHH